MKIYNHILQGHEATLENAIDHALHFDFSQCETEKRDKYEHSTLTESIGGVDIYYDYAADYYYFVEVCVECKGTGRMTIKVRDHEGCADLERVECECCKEY